MSYGWHCSCIRSDPQIAYKYLLALRPGFRLQDKIDDYLAFGVPCVWVIRPETQRAWMLTGMKQAVLLKSLHSCNQEALKDTQAETAVRDLGHEVHIECKPLLETAGHRISQSAPI